ncbi:30S ribosomal protein S17 [Candidatus Parcubacteria bacterium]|nr:30S ribosomal protein S17 [Candidatus Parcubacteria bacterium]
MPSRILKGTVVSDHTAGTVVVAVNTLKAHPKYRTRYVVTKRYQAHDPRRQYRAGDIVEIRESRPISKHKHWIVLHKVGAAVSKKSEL